MREELVVRNVARLAELPTWERKPITPWSAVEARAFLDAAKKDPLYPAFMLLLLYGLRRGEVLGLRWRDVDEEDGEIRIRQQAQRIKGELRFYPVKTAAGRRDPVGSPQSGKCPSGYAKVRARVEWRLSFAWAAARPGQPSS